MKKFVQTPNGDVHLMSPLVGGELTMCGIAFDAHLSEADPELEHIETKQRSVTCSMCADVVHACRGVRVLVG